MTEDEYSKLAKEISKDIRKNSLSHEDRIKNVIHLLAGEYEDDILKIEDINEEWFGIGDRSVIVEIDKKIKLNQKKVLSEKNVELEFLKSGLFNDKFGVGLLMKYSNITDYHIEIKQSFGESI